MVYHVDVNTSPAHGSVAFAVFVPVLHSFTLVDTAVAVGATLVQVYTADATEDSFPKVSLTLACTVAVLGPS